MKRLNLILAVLFSGLIIFGSCEEESSGPSCNTDIDDRVADLYDCPPDAGNCYEGDLAQRVQDDVLERVNYFRNIHNLPDVSYNPTFDDYVQKASLIAAANKALTHYPSESAKCYTAVGDTGSQKSNLALSWSGGFVDKASEYFVDGWISEIHSASIGHRRWILHPFLNTVSFGRVDSFEEGHVVGSALYVMDSKSPSQANVEFIACPFHNYPSSAFPNNARFSFQILADKDSPWGANRNVDFSNASIEVYQGSPDNSLSVNSVKYDNDGYGLPNCIQWKTSTFSYGARYTVNVSNVIVGGESKDYEYWFEID